MNKIKKLASILVVVGLLLIIPSCQSVSANENHPLQIIDKVMTGRYDAGGSNTWNSVLVTKIKDTDNGNILYIIQADDGSTSSQVVKNGN